MHDGLWSTEQPPSPAGNSRVAASVHHHTSWGSLFGHVTSVVVSPPLSHLSFICLQETLIWSVKMGFSRISCWHVIASLSGVSSYLFMFSKEKSHRSEVLALGNYKSLATWIMNKKEKLWLVTSSVISYMENLKESTLQKETLLQNLSYKLGKVHNAGPT